MNLLIFYSIDIVRSTPSKLLRGNSVYSNNIAEVYQNLKVDIKKFYESHNKEGEYLKLWKFIGDEWIFVQRVKNCIQFAKGFAFFYETLHNTVAEYFPVRSKIWLTIDTAAETTKIESYFDLGSIENILGHFLKKESNSHVKYDKFDFFSSPNLFETRDWIGQYMDIGFRYGKSTPSYHIGLSVEVAYMLSALFLNNVIKISHANTHTYSLFNSEKTKETKETKHKEDANESIFLIGNEQYLKDVFFPYSNICIRSKITASLKSYYYKKKTPDQNTKELNAFEHIDLYEIKDYCDQFMHTNFGPQRYSELINFSHTIQSVKQEVT